MNKDEQIQKLKVLCRKYKGLYEELLPKYEAAQGLVKHSVISIKNVHCVGGVVDAKGRGTLNCSVLGGRTFTVHTDAIDVNSGVWRPGDRGLLIVNAVAAIEAGISGVLYQLSAEDIPF